MRFPVFLVALAYAAGLAAFYQVDDSPLVLLGLTVVAIATGALFLRKEYSRTTLAFVLTGFFLLGGATIRLEEASILPTRIDPPGRGRETQPDRSRARARLAPPRPFPPPRAYPSDPGTRTGETGRKILRSFRRHAGTVQPARSYPNLAAKLVHCLRQLSRLE